MFFIVWHTLPSSTIGGRSDEETTNREPLSSYLPVTVTVILTSLPYVLFSRPIVLSTHLSCHTCATSLRDSTRLRGSDNDSTTILTIIILY